MIDNILVQQNDGNTILCIKTDIDMKIWIINSWDIMCSQIIMVLDDDIIINVILNVNLVHIKGCLNRYDDYVLSLKRWYYFTWFTLKSLWYTNYE